MFFGRKDIVGLNERVALAGEAKVPVAVGSLAVRAQEFCAVPG